jgi:hypothetical protein
MPIRNQAERRLETLNILYRLKENGYSGKYEAVKELIVKLNEYVNNEKNVKFNIPFPEFEKRIIGELFISKKQECVVRLTEL